MQSAQMVLSKRLLAHLRLLAKFTQLAGSLQLEPKCWI